MATAYQTEAYASLQSMREIAQEDPRNALGFLHDAIKHCENTEAIRVLASAYDRVYCELFPTPICTDEMVLEARSRA